MPPGTRLGYHEEPHDAILQVLKDELGIRKVKLQFWPTFVERKYTDKVGEGMVVTVPVPYQVQKELRPQGLGIPEHYDFVYVCLIDKEVELEGQLSPKWYSFEEIKEREENSKIEITFPDVIPTLENIFIELEKENVFL